MKKAPELVLPKMETVTIEPFTISGEHITDLRSVIKPGHKNSDVLNLAITLLVNDKSTKISDKKHAETDTLFQQAIKQAVMNNGFYRVTEDNNADGKIAGAIKYTVKDIGGWTKLRVKITEKDRAKKKYKAKSIETVLVKDQSKGHDRDKNQGKAKGHDKDKAQGKARGHDKDKAQGKARGYDKDKAQGKGREHDKYKEIDRFTIRRKIWVTVEFAVKDRNNKELARSILNKSAHQTIHGNTFLEATVKSLEIKPLLQKAVLSLSRPLLEQVAPHYKSVKKTFEKGKSSLIDDGNKAAKEGYWQHAAQLWEKATKTGNIEDQVAGLYNLAIYEEVEGDLDRALEKYEQVYRIARKDKFRNAVDQIKKRINDGRRLNELNK
ncbi:MAG: hypothetical protein KAJ19_05785 [Gammaproteobacteria bacterium]|nr:hypothetical protein [Gammaproteobacteria bacterium]